MPKIGHVRFRRGAWAVTPLFTQESMNIGVVINMTMFGKIVYDTSKLVGNTAEYGIGLTGNVISSIAEISGKDKLAKNTKKYSRIVGKVASKTSKIVGAVTAVLIDTTIDVTVHTAKYIAENAINTNVKIYGESDKFYDEDKYIEVEYKVLEK